MAMLLAMYGSEFSKTAPPWPKRQKMKGAPWIGKNPGSYPFTKKRPVSCLKVQEEMSVVHGKAVEPPVRVKAAERGDDHTLA